MTMENQNQNYGHNGVLDLDDLNLQNELQNPSAAQEFTNLYEVNPTSQGSGDDDFDLDDDDPSVDDDTLDDDDDLALDDDDLALDDDDLIADDDDDLDEDAADGSHSL
jgi:hypothetical protein